MFGLAPNELGYRRHLNLFARYAKGARGVRRARAADQLRHRSQDHARERAVVRRRRATGTSRYGNVMIGALSRRFVDATGEDDAELRRRLGVRDRRAPARVASRRTGSSAPTCRIRRGSPTASTRSPSAPRIAAMVQIAPMVVFSPMGPSAYDRPQLRFVYRAAHLNQGALDLYVPDDPRHLHAWAALPRGAGRVVVQLVVVSLATGTYCRTRAAATSTRSQSCSRAGTTACPRSSRGRST